MSRSMIFQGENLIVANIGDSRAVLASVAEDGSLAALQLTVDFKPNLPRQLSFSLFVSWIYK